jgi:murein DD-endopeptidase MepM/ murein hydrolase activator NlpD
MRLPLLVAALVLLAAPAPADPAFEARLRAEVDQVIEERHFAAKHVDVDAVIEQSLADRARGAPEPVVLGNVHALVERSHDAIAPRGALHDGLARYGFPFPALIPRFLVQGPLGEATHSEKPNRHAYDFVMAIGSPVVAARKGVVARVIDGFPPATLGDPDPMAARAANEVAVLHEDDTWAVYLHLQKGIAVKEGQRVRRGQRIARSGMSGAPFGPHLHFAVLALGIDGIPQSVPIRFGPLRSRGFRPEVGQYVGRTPRTNVELRVTLDGTPLPKDTPVPWKRGGRGVLEVVLVDASGGEQDVTRHAATRIDAMTPWNVIVEDGARLRFDPDEGMDIEHLDERYAIVQVLHRDRKGGRVGRAVVSFDLGS